MHCQQVKIMKTWDPTGREGPQTPLPDVVVVHTPKEDDFGVAAGGDKDGQVSKGSGVCEAAMISCVAPAGCELDVVGLSPSVWRAATPRQLKSSRAEFDMSAAVHRGMLAVAAAGMHGHRSGSATATPFCCRPRARTPCTRRPQLWRPPRKLPTERQPPVLLAFGVSRATSTAVF